VLQDRHLLPDRVLRSEAEELLRPALLEAARLRLALLRDQLLPAGLREDLLRQAGSVLQGRHLLPGPVLRLQGRSPESAFLEAAGLWLGLLRD
jgi:hypothetical protein